MCEINGCEKKAIYGIRQEFPKRCKLIEHREDDMVLKPRSYCEHNKQHNRCEECKDDLICEIDGCKNRSTYGIKQYFPMRCKIKEHREDMVTQPRAYCKHIKRHIRCVPCRGNGICLHNKQRSRCVYCKGSEMCEHKRRREQCTTCKGSAICTHGKRRYECKDCEGGGICKEHGKVRASCVECHGSQVCEHKRIRYRCVDCNGSGICEHKRRRIECKDCEGSQRCEHKRMRNTCVECKGNRMCPHKIERNRCFQCNPESNHFCIRRFEDGNRCTSRKNSDYDNKHCARCFVDLFPNHSRSKTAKLASKELKTKTYLVQEFPNKFIHNKKLFITDKDKFCTSYDRRIDFQIEVKDYVVCVEVDERQHKGYDPLDEELRIMQIYENAGKNLVIIRLNPDSYTQNGKLKKTPLKDRFTVLRDTINEVIDKINNGNGYNNWLTEIKLFFDDATKQVKKDITRCSGLTRKNKQCKNKVKKEGDFCHQHNDQ